MSTKQIVALLNSHVDGDEEQFLSIALQIAAAEARLGQTENAERLKKLVQKARDRSAAGQPKGQAAIPLARPRGELQGLVESSYPKTKLDSMVLADNVRRRLTRIVRQQADRATLRAHGQVPATHVLLVGPAGTGKTMTAAALAGELNLPLFTVRLEALFSRFFGETAGKLRLLFDQIAQTRAVYLLDLNDRAALLACNLKARVGLGLRHVGQGCGELGQQRFRMGVIILASRFAFLRAGRIAILSRFAKRIYRNMLHVTCCEVVSLGHSPPVVRCTPASGSASQIVIPRGLLRSVLETPADRPAPRPTPLPSPSIRPRE